jgi:hypothetical protein
MVIIDLVAETKEFGFSANQTIAECSFQKDGHLQKCVSNQQQPWSDCSGMKLAVIAFKDGCFIQNKGLALTGILAKKCINLLST